jgi:hypothetical protein
VWAQRSVFKKFSKSGRKVAESNGRKVAESNGQKVVKNQIRPKSDSGRKPFYLFRAMNHLFRAMNRPIVAPVQKVIVPEKPQYYSAEMNPPVNRAE